MSINKEISRRRKYLLIMVIQMLLLSALTCVDMFTDELADEVESSCRKIGMKYVDGECVPIAPDEENDSILEEDEEEIVNGDQGETISGEVYVGGIIPPPVLTNLPALTIDKNQVFITVDEDGTVLGEQTLIFNYTRSGVDNALVNIYEDYKTIFEGVLTDGHGQLTGTITHHFVSSGPGADDPQDRTVTFEATYDVHVSGDVLNAQIIEEIESENDLFSFEANKQ